MLPELLTYVYAGQSLYRLYPKTIVLTYVYAGQDVFRGVFGTSVITLDDVNGTALWVSSTLLSTP
jgi:hypothetical protein